MQCFFFVHFHIIFFIYLFLVYYCCTEGTFVPCNWILLLILIFDAIYNHLSHESPIIFRHLDKFRIFTVMNDAKVTILQCQVISSVWLFLHEKFLEVETLLQRLIKPFFRMLSWKAVNFYKSTLHSDQLGVIFIMITL